VCDEQQLVLLRANADHMRPCDVDPFSLREYDSHHAKELNFMESQAFELDQDTDVDQEPDPDQDLDQTQDQDVYQYLDQDLLCWLMEIEPLNHTKI
jgi:hypothetical protein